MKLVFAALIGGLMGGQALAGPQSPPERRCGWIVNPTPANWWLDDRDGPWVISVQGGYQAGGVELPDFSEHDWVVTNAGGHGYGCACLIATFDRRHKRVVNISAVKQRSLTQCKADRALKAPE